MRAQTFVHNLSRAVGPDTWTISELFLGYPFKESADLIANWVKSNNSDSAFAFPMTDSLRRALRVRLQAGSSLPCASQQQQNQ